MSNLGPQKIKSSYPGLLQVPGGITTTLQAVTDGSGNATPLLLSSTGVSITGLVSTTAENIYGGTAGSIVYQTGVSTTGFAAAGTTGQLLASNGVSAPAFVTVDSNYVGAVASTGDTMSGDLNMNGNLVKSVGTPIASGDAANKAYVDSVAVGLQPKTAARVATTANLGSLSGLLTIDGVTLIAGDRVLVKNQTLSQFNGVYVASSTTWLRATDLDTWNEFLGAYIYVSAGTVNAGTGWISTVSVGGTLDVTPIPFVQFSSTNSYSAGTGLSLIGSTFSITAPVDVTLGGTGVTTLTGIPYGNGTSAFTTASGAQIAIAIGTNSVFRSINLAGGSAGQVAYQSGVNATSFTSTGTAGQILQSNGSSAPTWTTILPIANGGTNSTATPTAGGVIYGNGTAYAATSAGTSGQVLQSNGSSAPTWVTPSSIYYNVVAYGADKTGATSSVTAINAAISAATAAGGGTVFFPEGTYLVTSTISIPNNVSFLGTGKGSSVITGNFASGNIIQIGTGAAGNNPGRVTISSLCITSSVSKTNGAAVRVINGHNIALRDIQLRDNLYIGVQFDGDINTTSSSSQQFIYYIDNFEINSSSNTGILVGDGFGSAANKPWSLVQDIWISNGVVAGAGVGVNIINASGVYVNAIDVIGCTIGIQTYPGANQVAKGLFLSQALADGCTTYGINIASNGGKTTEANLVNCWASSVTGGPGLVVNQGTGTVSGLMISSCRFTNNNKQGIDVQSATKFTIADCHITSNSAAGSGSYSGLGINNNLTDWTVVGGYYGKDDHFASNNQAYGIFVGTGCNRYAIVGVNAYQNVTGGLYNGSSSATQRYVAGVIDSSSVTDVGWTVTGASYSPNTAYTNSTYKPIFVTMSLSFTAANNLSLTVNGAVVAQTGGNAGPGTDKGYVSGFVPPGGTFTFGTVNASWTNAITTVS